MIFFFESAYKPKILKNWEIPKFNRERPQIRTAKTKFIANERGHLLPNIEKSNASPWGNYVGSWRLPKKINRKTANKLNGLEKGDPLNENHFDIEEKETNKENIDDNSVAVPYVPGDLTDKIHQLPSHNDLAVNRFPKQKSLSQGFPRTRDDFSGPLPNADQGITEVVNNFCELNREMVDAEYPRKTPDRKKEKRLLSPIIAAISNFSLAKKLHKENLEHNPLPDAVTDSMFRKIQMLRKEEPGLLLENGHFTTGVGWKGHPGYGPTRCTKMKIYRPKTCGHAIADDEVSVSSFDKKWRFIRQTKVTPMDLAICWDMCPENPKDEPRRPTHIDGSNGSAAPAVFSLVNTPKKTEEREDKCDGIHGCGPLFDHHNEGDELKEYFFHRSKSETPSSRNSKTKDSLLKKRAKSAYNEDKLPESKKGSDISKSRIQSAHNLNDSTVERNDNNVVVRKIHQSTPNLSEDKCSDQTCYRKIKNVSNSKLCVACELKSMTLNEKRPKSEYKIAFKAGVPQRTVSRPNYFLRVPKQKDPYMAKNYVIDSLAPPFSLQKTKRQDYPEHWRLATVYQHSYKPIHSRKRPLLHTIFK